MKKFDEYCKMVGYNPQLYVAPQPVYVWYVYDKGTVTRYASKEDVPKGMDNIEKVMTEQSKKEIDAFWYSRKELESKAYSLWYSDLEYEYSYLPTNVFELCYSQSYERGHYVGYDEVANIMDGVCEFANKIIEAVT